jgi:tetratricopeptide (TPR) repeat protein
MIPATNTDWRIAQVRHCRYYEKVLRNANRLFEQGGAALQAGLKVYEAELANIERAQAWAVAQSATDPEAARLCSELPDAGNYFFDLRQHPRERVRWREAALVAARTLGNRAAEAVHLSNLGIAHGALGDTERASEYYAERLVFARKMGAAWRRDRSESIGRRTGRLGAFAQSH